MLSRQADFIYFHLNNAFRLVSHYILLLLLLQELTAFGLSGGYELDETVLPQMIEFTQLLKE
jgi:hypothetical protein